VVVEEVEEEEVEIRLRDLVIWGGRECKDAKAL